MDMQEQRLFQEMAEFFPLIVRASRELTRELGAFADLGLPATQMHTLVVLRDQGCMNMSRLAGILHLQRPQLPKIIDALGRKELVVRKQAPKSRREVLVELTRKGEALLDRFYFGEDSDFVKSLNTLTSQQQEDLTNALSALNKVARDLNVIRFPQAG